MHQLFAFWFWKINIANVATRYILDKPAVAGVIIGVRLGIVDHRSSNMQTCRHADIQLQFG
jgi:hypothetical protein